MTKEQKIISFPDAESIEETAASWVARLDAQSLTPEDHAAMQKWIASNPRHRSAFEDMAAVWGGADMLDAYNFIDPVDASDGEGGRRSFITTPVIWGAIAASIAFAVVLGVLLFGSAPGIQSGTYATAVGEQRRIGLEDGSSVVLNTNSKIEIDFNRTERQIRLVSGEAHFEVAKDSRRPFLVYAGDGLVRAVGTAFSVHLRAEKVEVIVSEGVVELLSKAQIGGDVGADGETNNMRAEYATMTALAANEQALLGKDIERKEKIDTKSLERRLMWRDGIVVFAGEPLSEVVLEMSRYTDVQIEIADPTLANTPIGAAFKAGDVNSMFDAFESVFGIEVVKKDESHYVLERLS